MTDIQTICIILALFASIVHCDPNDDLGLMNITTPSNDDPNSCLLTLNYSLADDAVTFTSVQQNIDPSNPDCTHSDLQFAPYSRNANATGAMIALVPSANDSNTLMGQLNLSTITDQNGYGCLQFKGPNQTLWTCHFKYGSIFIFIDIYLLSNGSIDTNWINLLAVSYGLTTKVQRNDMDVWVRANNEYQNIVGIMGCGEGPLVINNLDTEVTIEGSSLQSNRYDLNKYLADAIVFGIFIQKVNSIADYTITPSPKENWMPFANASTDSCTDLGMKYSDIIPSLDYCSGGCIVLLGLFVGNGNGNYVLQTNGITTATSRLRA